MILLYHLVCVYIYNNKSVPIYNVLPFYVHSVAVSGSALFHLILLTEIGCVSFGS